MDRWLFLEVMERGGPVMWGILALSLVGVAIVIERLYLLRRDRVLPEPLRSEVEHYALEPPEDDDPLAASPLGVLLRRIHAAAADRDESSLLAEAEVAGNAALDACGRGLELLAVLAQTAPLLGLLGTVTGLLRAFASIASARTVDPSIVAGGVAEALLTTIFGLVVGIPLLIAHRLLRARVEGYATAFEEAALRAVRAHRAPRKK